MNFKPNKHELYLFNRGKERDRERILNFNIFCVINVKYKEISWRVRKRRRKKVTSRSTELILKKCKSNSNFNG